MEMHFVNQGSSKTPVIFLHAFPVAHEMWQHQVEALSDQVEVYAVDLPGFGSSPTLREDASIGAYAKAVTGFMDNQKIEKAYFCGCSMGGYIAFELWRTAWERCAGLILCNTRAEADTEQTKKARMESIETVRSEGLNPIAEGMIGKVFCETTLKEKNDVVEAVRHSILENSPIGVIHALQAMAARPDYVEDLESISVPTLVIVGEDDKVTPMTAAKRMADRIPNAELVVIPEAGHYSPLENPEAVSEAVKAFLGKK